MWIMIDDLDKHPPAKAMQECLAGLIGITDTAAELPPGLRALRWLLIGHIPDFVRDHSIEYELDSISQRDLGVEEWEACCRAAFISKGQLDSYVPDLAITFRDFAFQTNPVLQAGPPGPEYLSTLASTLALTIRKMTSKVPSP
jgi:hypothetical protein